MSGLEKLREVAEAAPERPTWGSIAPHLAKALKGPDRITGVDHEAWASHIATFDRPTVLALIDVADVAASVRTLLAETDPVLGDALDVALIRLREVAS